MLSLSTAAHDGTIASGSTNAFGCAKSGSSTTTAQQLGIMPPPQALALARSKGLDLVEISPTAVPPVCRIMDFGKYQYEQQKRARPAKKHQKVILVKEIKFRPKVDEHDYQFKKKHIERFLGEGDKVKATIFFRGRENAHPEIGRRILERLIGELGEIGDHRVGAAEGRQPAPHDSGAAAGREASSKFEVRSSKDRSCRSSRAIEAPPSASRRPRRASSCARKAFKRHILTSKPTRRKRHAARHGSRVARPTPRKLKRMLPYD